MLSTTAPRIPVLPIPDFYSDSRTHGYRGPTRNVHLPRTTTNGGGLIAKSDDGVRCVVEGKECKLSIFHVYYALFCQLIALRILRLSESPQGSATPEHKSSESVIG
jgi:hypothetical protein